MSIKVKRVMAPSPRAFQILNEYYLNAYFDASPIYEEVTATVTISGSYTTGFTTYDYSYSNSKTWSRVAITGDGGGSVSITGIDINGITEILDGSVSNINATGSDEFIMWLRPALDITTGSPAPMYAPQYPAAVFGLGSAIEASAVIGTTTYDDGVNPPIVTDIVDNVSCSNPLFTEAGTPIDPRFIVDLFSANGGASGTLQAVIEEDVSLWSLAKWRDFRDTYSASSTDANGIETTLEIVIG